jgi:EAL domain-containing protein (putative c-di-GMP-specific phosphodiesterase class I)
MNKQDGNLTAGDNPQARLREALENDEFALYCQPIRALNGAVHYPMAEVLVRLLEEEKAMLPPGEFLPAFEHFGMMPELDRWVVRRVARQLALGAGMPRFTVNISHQTLEDRHFPSFVRSVLNAESVKADLVLFEIDERDMLDSPAAVARFASAITVVGCGVIVDGFGGQSVSLAPLEALRPHYIKVDGTIIRRLGVNESSVEVLRSVLRFGDSLRIGVIAECVEDDDVLVRITALGVGYAQGFGICQPHPMEPLAVAQ